MTGSPRSTTSFPMAASRTAERLSTGKSSRRCAAGPRARVELPRPRTATRTRARGEVLVGAVTASATHRAIDAVWRIESARLIAGLARMVRDVGLAEELAQDALLTALERWPASGVPDNPGAWLMTTAKNHALDLMRRGKRLERKHEEIRSTLEAGQAS